MRVDPYLQFNGRCDEALAFYADTLGARTEFVSRFGETPGLAGPPGAEGKVMHAVFRIGESVVMASDGAASGELQFAGFSLALEAETDAEAERLFAALAKDGQAVVPIGPTPFASRFGIVADRFGVSWFVTRQGASQ